MFSLVILGILPPVSCTIVGGVVFWSILLFLHELRACAPQHLVFFDKVCIDQSDAAAIQEGIQNITAYLKHSSTLLVLLTDVYLKKIWTVFELTEFLALKPSAPATWFSGVGQLYVHYASIPQAQPQTLSPGP